MDLEQEIELRRKEIHSDRLSMSIGELENLYERGEIDIHPKFQRVLRWTDTQKARLIESLLLRIPMPPIFVAQDEGGKWDVVDGVQRLGTCFEFLGVLKDPEGNLKEPLTLSATALLAQIAGHTFSERDDTSGPSFSPSLQRDFRRLRVDVNIILKESDPSAKYELFERLNTGGAIASAQEVRNCVLVWTDESLFDWIKDLSAVPSFLDTSPLSDRLEKEGYRDELTLRVLTLGDESVAGLSAFVDINAYLNEKNRKLSAVFPKAKRPAVRARFESTFSLIREAAGEDGFRRYDSAKGTFGGPFLISAFEAVALGVWHNQPKWAQKRGATQKLATQIKKLWDEDEFTGAIGIGKPAKNRIPKTVPFGRSFFVP